MCRALSPRKPPVLELTDLEMGPKLGALCRAALRACCCSAAGIPVRLPPERAAANVELRLEAAPTELFFTEPATTSHHPPHNLPPSRSRCLPGDGASGEVFLASWRGRRVAVKVFVADRSPDGHSRDEMAIACSGGGAEGLG